MYKNEEKPQKKWIYRRKTTDKYKRNIRFLEKL